MRWPSLDDRRAGPPTAGCCFEHNPMGRAFREIRREGDPRGKTDLDLYSSTLVGRPDPPKTPVSAPKFFYPRKYSCQHSRSPDSTPQASAPV